MAEIPDTTDVDPKSRFDAVPKDKYPVEWVYSEKKPTKNGSGAFLEVEMEILSGPYAGRKLWDRLNLWNDNAQAVEIAQRQLAQACHAVGKIGVRNSEELHHKAMIADVRLVPEGIGSDGKFYDAKNEIRGYLPIKPTPVQTATRPHSATSPPADNAPPWRRAKQ